MIYKSKFPLLIFKFNVQEILVLNLISEGLTNQQIGDKIFKSRRTIDGVRVMLLSKSGTKNTAALIAFGFRSGILV
ncbi:LuxR C-terminal-related transcriptional regulator [Pedobacter sp. Leaf176]|uniref:LuxR C-terminal-related transcriptional regulator n=1 Tax=Pedobacter sp. Leaf176 TaxID=1736286 RepID=UPI0006FB6320|nr:hypothetical protein ASF92_16210 [Pedobacter sp. Leaf176]